MGQCINLKNRTKKGERYLYCSSKKKEISFNDCKCCGEKEYKKSKPMKKVSDKRVYTTDFTYTGCLKRDKNTCQMCGTRGMLYKDKNGVERTTLELHHIDGRGKVLTNDVFNCVFLCKRCHDEFHSKTKYWRPIFREFMNKKRLGENVCITELINTETNE